MGVSFRWWGELSQVLAGEPGQGEVGDFAPSVIEDQRVAAVRECVITGYRTRAGVELAGGPGDHLRHGVVLAAGDDQQRSAVLLPGIDGSRRRLLEVRGRGLEQRPARAGDRVLVEEPAGLALGQGVAEAVAELLLRECYRPLLVAGL